MFMSKGLQIAIATLSVFAAVWLITSWGASEGTFRYYGDVGEYVPEDKPGARSRVHGFVVEYSIEKDLAAGHVDFVIHDRDVPEATLTVRLLALDIPDLFVDGAEVVVEGRYENGRFLADRVMAKCPSKYETAPETEA